MLNKKIILFFAIVFMGFTNIAKAQDINNILPITAQEFSVKTNAFLDDLSDIDKKLSSLKLTDEIINEATSKTREAIVFSEDYREKLKQEMSYIERNIAVLGVKVDGVEEPDFIAEKRKSFNTQLTMKKVSIAQADLVISKAEELSKRLNEARQKIVIGSILQRYPAVINPDVIVKATKDFFMFQFDLLISPIDWFQNLSPKKQDLVKIDLLPIIFVLLLAFLIGRFLKKLILNKFGYDIGIEKPNYTRKLLAAISVSVATGVLPATIIGGVILWLSSPGAVISGYFAEILNIILISILVYLVIKAITTSVFSPINDNWKLINISNDKSQDIRASINFLTLILVLAGVFEYLVSKGAYSQELNSLTISIASFFKALAITLVARRVILDDNTTEKTEEEEILDEEKEEKKVSILFVISVVVFGAFVVSLLGYTSLASFIFSRLLITSLVVSVLFLLRGVIDEIITKSVSTRYLRRKLKIGRKLSKKIGFWFKILIDPVVFFLGLYILLPYWGVPEDIITGFTSKLISGFTVGGVKISLVDISMSLVIFVLSVSIVKILKQKLMTNVLAHTEMDDSLKHSLVSGFGYVGFILAATLSIAVIGIDMSNLAIVAGALSFGVGLGLQNVVNNFVSGIILLVERPIKVGDWIIINGQEGFVRQINIRATELETWKKANIIIPNSEVLSTSLVNLTHEDKYGRIDISVGVAYGSDVKLVEKILLEVAAEHKKVVKNPESTVMFSGFGDSSLDFELRCFTSDVMKIMVISSEMRYEIDRKFRENNIEIPFPQRVVHMKNS